MTKTLFLGAPICIALSIAISALPSNAQVGAPKTFSEAVQQIIRRPEYKHAMFGLEIYSLDTQKPLFMMNADKLVTPGSTTKLLTEGTALKLLGPDYRFHTLVYRTGQIDDEGNLKGDVVLVASGDPNISNRMQPDGTLAFADEDHTYGGPDARLIPGDPLIVMREFAKQVAASGIKHILGSVFVDVSLFPEGHRELGTGDMISPISLNDNVIDVRYVPAKEIGSPAQLTFSPQLPYIYFENRIVTVAGAKGMFSGQETIENPDGTQTVVLNGSIGQASGPVLYGYPISSPSRFAATTLTASLKDIGVSVDGRPDVITDASKTKQFYKEGFKVAEHISTPLSEEIKVTLKVSQNLHASMMPYTLGAVLGKATEKIDEKGFALEKGFLMKAGLDLSGASQSDGAGGAPAAFYSPDFITHFLAYMAKEPNFAVFEKALPVLGHDGTLVDTQRDTPAAGHVFAKTGTLAGRDLLNGKQLLIGKGLSGYTTTTSGQHLAFALYVNHVELADDRIVTEVAGQALGEIAGAAYSLPIDKSSLDVSDTR